MPKPLVFHITGRKLVIALLLTVVPISLAALYAATRAGETTASAAGRHLENGRPGGRRQHRTADRGEGGGSRADGLGRGRAGGGSATRTGNISGCGRKLIRERLLAKDQTWVTPQGEALVEQTMSNAGSEALRRKLTVDPSFLRITVTDLEGATVAATHKTLDYYQADEEYWQDIYFYGRGGGESDGRAVRRGDEELLHRGRGCRVVRETNQIMGTLDALVQVGSLLPGVAPCGSGGGRQGVSGEEGRGGDLRDGRA